MIAMSASIALSRAFGLLACALLNDGPRFRLFHGFMNRGCDPVKRTNRTGPIAPACHAQRNRLHILNTTALLFKKINPIRIRYDIILVSNFL
jgi:hypothetical protein